MFKWRRRELAPRLLMVLNDFLDDELQKFFSEVWIQICPLGQSAKSVDLFCFPPLVGGRQIEFGFQFANLFGFAKPFSQNVNERRVKIVDGCAVASEFFFGVNIGQ